MFQNNHLLGPSHHMTKQKKIAAAAAAALLPLLLPLLLPCCYPVPLLLPLQHMFFFFCNHRIALVGGPAASNMFAGNFKKVRLVLRVAL